MDFNKKDLVLFQIKRKLTDNSKQFLFILEDLRDDGYNIPDEKFIRMRKRILDNLNDSYRDLTNIIENINKI